MLEESQSLREVIERLFAASRQSDLNHVAALAAMRDLHAAEMLALADVIDVDAAKLREAAAEVETLKQAMATRDVIGQAKGILMATLRCPADEAFALLVRQSQHENRKVHDISAEIAAHAARQQGPSAGAAPTDEQ
ncbi:MAG TPA: ANTAR domain-containing protein [Acidimicrobiales bacterium]|nr:ANTAR domain-containing protein [Acidimicrobiales bacterium]